MKALFPGSFNPWHEGHQYIYDEASKLFNVTVGIFSNEDKALEGFGSIPNEKVAGIVYRNETLFEVANKEYDVVIRGLRNSKDLEYEATQLYWNRKLGLNVPVIYIVCPPELMYVSSTALRTITKLKGK